ncbi:MAG: glycoside hydrolase family 9 protein, partial [Planctomycetes bacterium]|nr:glycoside hydrolase family 9 protein [Planctomycetota bacterium]
VPEEERASYLDKVKLPDTLTHIGREAFRECAWLRSIRLPKNLADPKLRAHAIAGLEQVAQRQIAYSKGMSFMWSAPLGDPGFPLILSCNAAPWGQPLCRAYAVTGKREYLDYAVRTTLFSVGANPQNRTFTTRLGHRSPEFPLQCNTMAAHQPKPYSGYTVYGLAALGPAPQWVTQWHIPPTAHAPAIDTWPIEESYWDVECWPMVNENTVHQSMSPAVYVWGFLAARD